MVVVVSCRFLWPFVGHQKPVLGRLSGFFFFVLLLINQKFRAVNCNLQRTEKRAREREREMGELITLVK